jgi:NitT/TauT family transport system permease protein
MRISEILPLAGFLAALVGLAGAFGSALPVDPAAWRVLFAALMLVLASEAVMRLVGRFRPVPLGLDVALVVGSGVVLVMLLNHGVEGAAQWPFWGACIAVWLAAWQLVEALVRAKAAGWRSSLKNLAVPILFGATLLFLWETIVRGAGVPRVILPPPTAIGWRFFNSIPVLAADFVQTFHGVAVGYLLGCGAGFLGAILIDRVGFLQRGLLPLGNLVSALPIVGIAPIMVMWFGFDWPSKAAVVVIMTFFPMLVNTVAGLAAAGAMERDLMKTYGASYRQTLVKLRLPAALPFVFNGLKVNSTLALIGAIVAEFFGTPIVGMGFRINTEVGRMNIDMVWATIVVAALAGSLFYGLLALVERQVTFWHASYRQRPA